MNRTFAALSLAFILAISGAPAALAQSSIQTGTNQTPNAVQSGTTQVPNTTQTGTDNTSQGALFNPLSSTTLMGFVTDLLKLVTTLLGPIIVVFMLVYTGFKYVIARGNSSKIEEAHEALKWTVIGALILLGATAIAAGIQATVSAL